MPRCPKVAQPLTGLQTENNQGRKAWLPHLPRHLRENLSGPISPEDDFPSRFRGCPRDSSDRIVCPPSRFHRLRTEDVERRTQVQLLRRAVIIQGEEILEIRLPQRGEIRIAAPFRPIDEEHGVALVSVLTVLRNISETLGLEVDVRESTHVAPIRAIDFFLPSPLIEPRIQNFRLTPHLGEES